MSSAVKDDVQRRAKVGGEIGANGEFYEGGKFIATKDNPKSAPVKFEASPEQLAYREECDRRRVAVAAWLAARQAELKPVIDQLRAMQPAGSFFEDFHAGLGRQLFESGSLSRKQALFAAKAVLGRRTNKNDEAHEALIAQLTVEFPREVR